MASAGWTTVDHKKTLLSQFSAIRRVSRIDLQSARRNLIRWQRDSNASRRCTADNQQALDDFQIRLNFLEQTFQNIVRNETGQHESNFILDSSQQECLHHLEQSSGWARLTKSSQSLARFVFWMAGEFAFLRFVNTMKQIPKCPENAEHWLALIPPQIQWLNSLSRRYCVSNSSQIGLELENNTKHQKLMDWLRRRYKKQKGRASHLKKRIEYLQGAATEISQQVSIKIPCTIATMAICVQQGEHLPTWEINELVNKHRFGTQIANHVGTQVALSHSSHYSKFVEFTNRNPSSQNNQRSVLNWLEYGLSDQEVSEALRTKLLAHQKVNLKRLLRCQRQLSEIGHQSVSTNFSDWLHWVRNDKELENFERIVIWLAKMPVSISAQQTRRIMDLLLQVQRVTQYGIPGFEPEIHQWTNRANSIAQQFPAESDYPKDIRIWLRKLGYFQKLAGTEVRIPNSVLHQLQLNEKREREKSKLSQLIANSQASPGAIARFHHLQKESHTDQSVNAKKRLKTVIEACLETGLDSLHQIVLRHSVNAWREHTGHPPAQDWSDNRVVEVAGWVMRMQPVQRKTLCEILRAYESYGPAYKQNLACNQTWLRFAKKRNLFEVDKWLQPPVKSIKINGETVTLAISHNPYDIFMMGNWFGTCLSQNDINEMAVLANAAHANKHVLYVRNAEGQILGRLLLGINQQYDLLRYTIYIVNAERLGKLTRESIIAEVDKYCGAFAAEARLKLSKTGAPASLSGHFWYDDGAWDWSEQAIVSYIAHPVCSTTVSLPIARPDDNVQLVSGSIACQSTNTDLANTYQNHVQFCG